MERQKWTRYRKIRCMIMGAMVLLIAIAAMTGRSMVSNRKQVEASVKVQAAEKEAAEKTAAAEKTVAEKAAEKIREVKKAKEAEKAAEKEAEEIKAALAADPYGVQLGALYEKYPKTADLILNRKEYPDSLVEYLIGHEEALDWVLDYPTYQKKSVEELNQLALEKTDLKQYELQGNIPVYYQWDKTWGYASYGNGCIAIEGCGPTCLSMVATGLTGDTSMTPKMIADYSAAGGFYTEAEGTAWSLMSDGAAALGLTAIDVQWNESAIKEQLEAGHPIICSMGPGDFTQVGHFIVLAGVDSDGKIILNDPNSQVHTQQRWEIQTLMDQMKAMWAYSY